MHVYPVEIAAFFFTKEVSAKNKNLILQYQSMLLLFVLGFQAVRHARIMRRCGLEQVCCSNLVPTSDRGQSSPRL